MTDKKSKVSDDEWEVLPPERKSSHQELEPLFRWIALLMDDLIRLPGTKFRFGIDPLIGLIPGIGDTGTPASIADRTNRAPGSDSNGVPASETSASVSPCTSRATARADSTASLCSW